MNECTLVPFDGSPLSKRALKRALDQHPDGPIVALFILDPLMVVYEAEAGGLPAATEIEERLTALADEVCGEAETIAAESGSHIKTATAMGQPAREILRYVAAHDVDHVVMGSHGRRGLSRLVLGSVAERVVREAPVPVTIVR